MSCNNLHATLVDHPSAPTTSPRFTWWLDNIGGEQSAFQIRVAETRDALSTGTGLLFDSGKMISDLCNHSDDTLKLLSRQVCYWQLRVWDDADQAGAWSEPQAIAVGLLGPADWHASWISPAGQKAARDATRPAIFRKDFTTGRKIKRAIIYATARGVYELAINGRPVGDHVLAPGWTSYRRRLQYQTHDVTELLREGENAVSATLADGWFRGPLFNDNRRNQFGPRGALLVQLEIDYADGTRQTVRTDGSWRESTGSLQLAEIQHGEIRDFRLEPKGWKEPGFDDRSWAAPDELAPGTALLVAQSASPMRRIQTVRPTSLTLQDDGRVIADFGQNMVGWVRLKAQGEAGTTIILRHAELLDPANGALYTHNLRTARQTCVYTLAGTGEEICEAQFSLQGFRYASIEGFPGELKLDDLEGVVVHSDMAPTGSFETSNPLINQLQSNIVWGQKGNFLDVPLDCPQRDERLGWTGDAQVFAPTAAFNMDVQAFFDKWLDDVAAEQTAEGAIPFVVPSIFDGAGAVGWGDVATFTPMMLYSRYGDKARLARHYPMMKKWISYMEEKAGADRIWTGHFQFGDWLDFFSSTRGTDHGLTSEDLIATAFYARSTALGAQAADILGHNADASYYRRSFTLISEAFQQRWVSLEGVIAEDTQAAYVFALSFDLLDEAIRPKAAARLASDIRHRGHLTTGFLATPLLLDVLTRFGYLDLAYMLIERKEYPSWLYPVTKGATTIWERWDGIKPDGSIFNPHMNSFNHYAYGAVGDWMYRTIGGIAPAEPGYKLIRIAPKPGGSFTWARTSLDSPYGPIECSWRLEDSAMHLDVVIPAGTYAIIELPYGKHGLLNINGRTVDEVPGALTLPGEGMEFRLPAGSYAIAGGQAVVA